MLNELIRLSAIFEFARVELNMSWLKNPVDEVPSNRKPKYRPRSRRFGDREWAPVLAACRASRCSVLAPIVELALETACRRSELVELLHWEKIDLARATAKIEDTKSSTGEYRERTIGLSERAVEILRELGIKKRGRVFNVRPDNITRNFRKACEKAGVADLTLHDHRGEGASRMAQDMGVDIVELAAQGGWKDLKTLAKYYQPSPEKIARKLKKRAG